MYSEQQAASPHADGGCGESATPGAEGGAMGNSAMQGGSAGYPQPGGQPMGAPPDMGMSGAAYMGQGGAMPSTGPDMGQPHFSGQMPGAAPYQGSPNAYVSQQPQAGYYTMGNVGSGQPSAGGMPQGGFAYGGVPQGAPVYPGGAPQGATAQPGGPYVYPGAQPQQPGTAAPAPSEGEATQNRYGELYGLIQEAANGNPDVSKFLNFFTASSADFWKGAVAGAGLTLLLTNNTIKNAIAGSLAGVWSVFTKDAEAKEAEEDRKAEEAAAKEG